VVSPTGQCFGHLQGDEWMRQAEAAYNQQCKIALIGAERAPELFMVG